MHLKHCPFQLRTLKNGIIFFSGLNEHVMRMAANSYTPVSDKLIPTGEIASVAGTLFDLRCPTLLGQVLPR